MTASRPALASWTWSLVRVGCPRVSFVHYQLVCLFETALSPLLLVPFFSKRQRITVGLLEELGTRETRSLSNLVRQRISLAACQASRRVCTC